MREHGWTRVLGWPGYRVYQKEIDEPSKKLKLWVRRKRAGLKLICSGCGQHVPASAIHEICEREVRDLPCFEYSTTVVVETYRVKCPRCGIRAEKVAQLPSKAPFSKRFEEAVGQACESASARQVARRMGLAASTVRAMDLRYLERWEASRRKPSLRQMGIDELYRGKKGKFLTVVCNLESGEPLWFGRERKKETLDEFFRSQLSSQQRKRLEAACVDMWTPYSHHPGIRIHNFPERLCTCPGFRSFAAAAGSSGLCGAYGLARSLGLSRRDTGVFLGWRVFSPRRGRPCTPTNQGHKASMRRMASAAVSSRVGCA